MTNRKNLLIKVDDSNFNLEETVPKMEEITRYGMRKIADNYRDLLRKNYRDESHKSAYGSRAPFPQSNPKSMSSFLVTSEARAPGYFTVGPKLGSMKTSGSPDGNVKTYEEIFAIEIAGYKGEPYIFKLREDRQSASEDGMWRITHRKPKKFAENTWKMYESGLLEVDVRANIKKLIDKEFE